jgi:diguanylate cyclase (GGDEF)-like protein
MAIATTPIMRGRSLLDLLRQSVLPQERAVDLYRRLLAINELSGSMNTARDIGDIHKALTFYFQEYLPDDSVWLHIRNGSKYQKLQLSGRNIREADGLRTLEGGMAESVMKSMMPLWIPDVRASRKISKFAVHGEILAHSLMALPFSAMGRTAGCLEMLSNQPNRFDEIEYHFGSLVVFHLSSSLENVIARQELAAANARLRDHDLRMNQLNEKIQQLAQTDDFTGLFNKRRLFEQLQMETARARRYGEVFCCLMIDIDDFKRVNDSYGHQAGDEVLRQTAALLRRSLRVTDFIARYGGEEFTVILPRTNSAGAYRAAENLRSAFMSHEFALQNAMTRITISIGIACCATFDHLDAQEIIMRADSALYRAKRCGKNHACFADETDILEVESGFCQTHERGLTQQTAPR